MHLSQRLEHFHREPPIPSCQKVLLLGGVFSGEACGWRCVCRPSSRVAVRRLVVPDDWQSFSSCPYRQPENLTKDAAEEVLEMGQRLDGQIRRDQLDLALPETLKLNIYTRHLQSKL